MLIDKIKSNEFILTQYIYKALSNHKKFILKSVQYSNPISLFLNVDMIYLSLFLQKIPRLNYKTVLKINE